ncbi:MAG: cytochrome c biogenesis protein CcsA [Planctomycetes bacterium]|nr:cytochrome c biogenesis protein CcsA [Planctomycetota bacterium]
MLLDYRKTNPWGEFVGSYSITPTWEKSDGRTEAGLAPHVAVYMMSYLLLAKAAVQALAVLFGKITPLDKHLLSNEEGAYRMVCFGFPLLTLGLILGSVWGKLAWGDYWNWDPKELCSLTSWLTYLGYFLCRYMYGKKYPRLNSLWVILGILMIIVTLLWVNLSKLFSGLHSYSS